MPEFGSKMLNLILTLTLQAIVLDIVTMLFTLVRQYFPAEIRWSPLMNWYDMFAFNACICTIVYCIVCALL